LIVIGVEGARVLPSAGIAVKTGVNTILLFDTATSDEGMLVPNRGSTSVILRPVVYPALNHEGYGAVNPAVTHRVNVVSALSAPRRR
jgi:hypothetical protein